MNWLQIAKERHVSKHDLTKGQAQLCLDLCEEFVELALENCKDKNEDAIVRWAMVNSHGTLNPRAVKRILKMRLIVEE